MPQVDPKSMPAVSSVLRHWFDWRRSPKSLGVKVAIAAASVALLHPALSLPAFSQDREPPAPEPGQFQDSPKQIVDEAWQIINREYVDGQFNQNDWQAIRQDLLSRQYTSRDEAYEALRKAIKLLNDPYTRFMTPEQFEELTNQTAGELSGIGIRMGVDDKTKHLQVVEPMPNSPAARAGLKTGDLILTIDGQATKDMSPEKASSLIRGQAGTAVKLEIQRAGGAPFSVSLTRARIEVPIVRSNLQTESGIRVGYIRLNEFSAHAAEQMERAIEDLKGKQAEAFVLDLRGNPGGLLNASIEIARMWLDAGSIVSTTDRAGNSQAARANRTSLTNLPLAVLVDGNSASASEILTGALKDNRRALVVGSQTFGKALVQSVHSLGDGSGLAVTIAHYYTPAGTDINKTGISPDVEIKLSDEQEYYLFSNGGRLLATESDPQYTRAVTMLRNRIAANNNVAPLPQ